METSLVAVLFGEGKEKLLIFLQEHKKDCLCEILRKFEIKYKRDYISLYAN
jgi:hypothetical protein